MSSILRGGDATKMEAEGILKDETLAEEELLAELEKDDIPSHIRDARMAEMKEQVHQFQRFSEKGYGTYVDIEKEKAFLDLTTSEEKVVIHFYHPDFRRCSIVDKHLKILAEKHYSTKFGKMNVENAKFLVQKLKVQVLPTVLSFKDGIVIDRIVGFEELGNTDSFVVEVLERRLAKSEVIVLPEAEVESKTIFGFQRSQNDSSSDED